MIMRELREAQEVGQADMGLDLADRRHGGVAGAVLPMTQRLQDGLELRRECARHIDADPLGDPAAATGRVVLHQHLGFIADLGDGERQQDRFRRRRAHHAGRQIVAGTVGPHRLGGTLRITAAEAFGQSLQRLG
jgi:hypothetical protein